MSDHEPTAEEIELASSSGVFYQPSPVPRPELPSAHDLVLDDIDQYCAPTKHRELTADDLALCYREILRIHAMLAGGPDEARTEITNRKNFGLAKYGTALTPFNGRDALADALDELGDLLVYLRCAIYERRQAENGKSPNARVYLVTGDDHERRVVTAGTAAQALARIAALFNEQYGDDDNPAPYDPSGSFFEILGVWHNDPEDISAGRAEWLAGTNRLPEHGERYLLPEKDWRT